MQEEREMVATEKLERSGSHWQDFRGREQSRALITRGTAFSGDTLRPQDHALYDELRGGRGEGYWTRRYSNKKKMIPPGMYVCSV